MFRQFGRTKKLVVSAVLVLGCLCTAVGQSAPRVYFLDAQALVRLRGDFTKAGKNPARAQVLKFADKAMTVGPYSVTMKERVPPSGDKHDFLSMAPYHWPDPKSPNGLPYIRRDGERNPEAAKVTDRDYLVDTVEAAYTLSVAYYLIGEEKYAERAALLLRTWFLDPATRMNPNMNHAQYIAGVNTGRGAGLIETRHISRVVDALGLLAGAKAWTVADERGMHEWLAAYFEWLQTSKNGRSEAKAPNNHGAWYEQQLATVALYLGNDAVVRDVVEKRAKARISHQFEPDGRQLLELERTKAMHYSTFNLLALTHLARAGDASGVDLWNFRTEDGRSIRNGLDWLLPYVAGEKKWQYQQIRDYEYDVLEPVLFWAALKYDDVKYANAAIKLASSPQNIDEVVLRAAWEQRAAELPKK
jgi:hypothetical protein